jgi:Lon-like protease
MTVDGRSPPPIPAPPLELPEAPPPPRRRRGWLPVAIAVPLVLVLYAMAVIRLPYFVIEPGPAQNVEPLIHISNHQTFTSKGQLLLTSVSFFRPNAYQALRGWIDSSEAVIPERQILQPGQNEQQEVQVALSEMDQSKIDAAVVALGRYANYPQSHGSGALVEFVQPETPADGKLFAGDLITAIDGSKVQSAQQVGPPIVAAGTSRPVRFTVQAGGKTRQVSVTPGRVQGIDHPAVGIAVVDNFPFPLTISSGEIGGPSAGLMWTLGLIDTLTPGDMTAGRVIAGTGTIATNGDVGPIGGIEQKVVGAERAGAVVFFAPATEAADARAVAHGIQVVPVRTYMDALKYLGQS